MSRWALECYDAVRDGIPRFMPLLASNDPMTRMWTAYVLGWFPEERRFIRDGLYAQATREMESEVGAVICIASALLGRDEILRSLLEERLQSEDSFLKWAAAIGITLIESPISSACMNELAACIVERKRFATPTPFGSQLSDFANMLVEYEHGIGWRERSNRILSPGLQVET